MKAYEIQAFGLEHVKQVDRPELTPAAGQVLVQVKATSLNFRDLLMAEGKYNPRLKMPIIPLSDGAGEIIGVGAGVNGFKEGDRVCACFVQGWIAGEPHQNHMKNTLGGPNDGMLAEQVLLPEHSIVKIPEHLSYEEAATLPCAALTAWSSMVTYGDTKAGDTVLVLGTGGVSIFALQLARLLGARVIATSSSDEKLEKARELGADAVINYSKVEAWDREAYKLTGKRGVDNVIEVGGAGTLERSLRAVRPGGQISLIGILAGGVKDLNLLPILMRNIRMQGIIVGHREGFEAMNRAIELHKLKPVVDKVFEFNEAVEAMKYLKSGKHFGKVCIKI